MLEREKAEAVYEMEETQKKDERRERELEKESGWRGREGNRRPLHTKAITLG